ncbi:hypothetical protein, unlikely [Trypanosoma brucei brucei TREU927]|uniref:Uncharacterized protein n=1 Tax=Trypanosoma brucei brucei (strain 927/4 GUTat10.1) TaxID=185431 RepID=Q38FU1_TRYB2|nr:hypothetical protein, unlikely [Trypanosoma brucei brucei TREU927]EAN76329.1 hypothetical protein, unlikely [Trypanosoma brucei brucei TREU927]
MFFSFFFFPPSFLPSSNNFVQLLRLRVWTIFVFVFFFDPFRFLLVTSGLLALNRKKKKGVWASEKVGRRGICHFSFFFFTFSFWLPLLLFLLFFHPCYGEAIAQNCLGSVVFPFF